jgi:transcriptional antiterminator RfaH
MNLKRQEFSTFLPREEVTIRARNHYTPMVRPLFPGYIFVAFSPNRSRWQTINSTLGVKRLVTFGDTPAIVPLEVVSRLMLRCDRSGKLLPPRLLSHGNHVRVISGPLVDFVATVEQIAPSRRVWVLLELMGNLARVAVSADGLRLIDETAHCG